MSTFSPQIRWQISLVKQIAKDQNKAELTVLKEVVEKVTSDYCLVCGGPCMLPEEPA